MLLGSEDGRVGGEEVGQGMENIVNEPFKANKFAKVG